MSSEHDFSALGETDALEALYLLGISPEQEDGEPEQPDERTSGYLAMLLAATQAHIQTRARHAALIEQTYHAAFEHFTGQCPAHPHGEPTGDFHPNGGGPA